MLVIAVISLPDVHLWIKVQEKVIPIAAKIFAVQLRHHSNGDMCTASSYKDAKTGK